MSATEHTAPGSGPDADDELTTVVRDLSDRIEALQADVAWLHQALAFAESASETAAAAPAGPDPDILARWREQIAEAVRAENYEEAARLNRLIQGNAQRPGLGFA